MEVQVLPPGAVPVSCICRFPVRPQNPCLPEHSRPRFERCASETIKHKKPVGFFHRAPKQQASPRTKTHCVPLMSRWSLRKYQSFDNQGFSKMKGVLYWMHACIIFKVARAVRLPSSNRMRSRSETSKTPQGASQVRMTAVRSRAREKEVHGVASITPRQEPSLMHLIIPRSMWKFVKSYCIPLLISYS